jgi:hypothetical protein
MSSQKTSTNTGGGSWRAGVAMIFFWINIFMFIGSGIGFMLVPDNMLPNISLSARPSLRGFGALNISYGLLLLSLGSQHHGAYCLTMFFHMLTAGAVGSEAVQATDEGLKPRFTAAAIGHGIAALLMLGLLVTGGINNNKSHGNKRNE